MAESRPVARLFHGDQTTFYDNISLLSMASFSFSQGEARGFCWSVRSSVYRLELSIKINRRLIDSAINRIIGFLAPIRIRLTPINRFDSINPINPINPI